MKKQILKTSLIAIMLSILIIPLTYLNAQNTIGSQISFQKDESIKYLNGSVWVNIPSGLPGQDLIFTNGSPSWVNSPNGIVTDSVTNIIGTTALCGGFVKSSGGSAITTRGVCWSTNHNPTIADSHTSDDIGKGHFVSHITGLNIGNIYYFRAYATNNVGTVYGNEVNYKYFDPAKLYDYDGNVYDTVHIGTQVWMKSNLKVTHYLNGDSIPNVTNNTAWINLSSGAYSYYNNDINNLSIYGRMYNWYAIVDSRFLCPSGWHIPNDAEFTTLTDYLGGQSIAASKLKEAGFIHWVSPNSGTNETGFTALPSGVRNYDGTYNEIGHFCYLWSTTEYSTTYAWLRGMSTASNVNRVSADKRDGFTVRCLKDSLINVIPVKPVYDIDGNGYDTIRIGSQTWMKQNLKTTKYRTGDTIPNVISNSAWAILASGAYCNYNNDTTNGNTYGRLYNYYTISNTKGLCPTGWHTPSDAEYTTLTTYLGGETIAGGKLKEAGLSHWASPNIGATNESGFTALPGAYRNSSGAFFNYSYDGYWWSSTVYNSTTNAWIRYMDFNNSDVYRAYLDKKYGYSVRCIKDSVINLVPVPVYDVDGNKYDTVVIGSQVWMKQNLKTTKYRNGDAIPNLTYTLNWSGTLTGAYCNYDNDTNNGNIYGRLYNFYAVADSRNLCPTGWHVPTDVQWATLSSYLGGDTIAGGKLKEVGSLHWTSPNDGASNLTNFTALPGGYRYQTGPYDLIGSIGLWWSSTIYSSSNAWHRGISNTDGQFGISNNNKHWGLSIRCLKD